MASHQCSDCKAPEIPPPVEIARALFGDRWWATSLPSELVQAEAVLWLWRAGRCGRHSAIGAALVAIAVRAENARRAVLPGTVEVRHVHLDREPFEPVAASAARREGRPLVERVQAFVAGSALSAIVELDLGHRRARVTLQLLVGDRPRDTIIETPRLVHLTAQELVAALRDRAADQAR